MCLCVSLSACRARGSGEGVEIVGGSYGTWFAIADTYGTYSMYVCLCESVSACITVCALRRLLRVKNAKKIVRVVPVLHEGPQAVSFWPVLRIWRQRDVLGCVRWSGLLRGRSDVLEFYTVK